MAIDFTKRKESSLMGHTVVIFDCKYPEGQNPTSKFRIECSRYGIALHGESPLLESMDDLQSFAKWTSQAWTEHRKLVPRIEIAKEIPHG